MREITSHIADPSRCSCRIKVVDEPSFGGASHEYLVELQNQDKDVAEINFQKGAILEHGINGLTQEVLLAIVIDRLQGFQSGDFSCRENAIAITKCQEALMWLQKRTRDRITRGVEGKNVRR